MWIYRRKESYYEYSKKNDYLAHHGILGQKWGIRRYQNLDGTLTEEGKKRYVERPLSAEQKKQKAIFEYRKSLKGKHLTMHEKSIATKKYANELDEESKQYRNSLKNNNISIRDAMKKVEKYMDQYTNYQPEYISTGQRFIEEHLLNR